MRSCARIFLLLVIYGIVLPSVVHGADDSDVEVNYESLEQLEGYVPPPMFESERKIVIKPLTEISIKKIEKKPKPAYGVITKPPIPPRRPAVFNATQEFVEKARAEYYKDEKTTKSDGNDGQFAKNLPVKPTIIPPPSPPGAVRPKAAAVASAYKPVSMKDPLQAELMNPTVQEILASIDDGSGDKEELSPAAAPPADIIISNEDVSVLSESGNSVSLEYQLGASSLSSEIKRMLLNKVNKQKASGLARVELQGYATSVDQSLSSARRVSLARALTIRDYLAENGLDANLISVRPMGDASERTPRDRVDIYLVEP